MPVLRPLKRFKLKPKTNRIAYENKYGFWNSSVCQIIKKKSKIQSYLISSSIIVEINKSFFLKKTTMFKRQ